MIEESLTNIVKEKYGATARAGLSSENDGVRSVAEAFGYTADELSRIPAEANMGLSCGNPIALANLRAGEVVVDLGSGGGLDVFLAAAKVGPTGRAIGIDMTPDMVALAKRNAAKGDAQGAPYENVEFLLGEIDKLPLPDASADVIISNCVINLAADKSAVFREMYRVLRPGGRVAVSDIALKKPLPAELARDVAAFVGCISGAIAVEKYESGLREAGFASIAVVDAQADLNAYAKVEGQVGCCSPAMAAPPVAQATCCVGTKTVSLAVGGGGCCGTEPAAEDAHEAIASVLERHDVNEFAASVKVFAIKM